LYKKCQEKTAQENLQHPVADAVFFVHKSAKKYGENKNSVYWKTKGRSGKREKERKRRRERKTAGRKSAGRSNREEGY